MQSMGVNKDEKKNLAYQRENDKITATTEAGLSSLHSTQTF